MAGRAARQAASNAQRGRQGGRWTRALAETRAALALLKIAVIAGGVLFVLVTIAMHSGHGS